MDGELEAFESHWEQGLEGALGSNQAPAPARVYG